MYPVSESEKLQQGLIQITTEITAGGMGLIRMSDLGYPLRNQN